MTTIHTIKRLRALKPGEHMTYYTGNLELDIGESVRVPNYRDTLKAIHDEAQQLERAGKVRLLVTTGSRNWTAYDEKRGTMKALTVTFNEYHAIGVNGGESAP